MRLLIRKVYAPAEALVEVVGGAGVGFEIQGYLAHKKQHPPLRTTLWPKVQSYCRVLGARCF